jgi:hypothetical protein
MFKIFFFFIFVVTFVQASAGSASQKALRDLDCEFEDCKPKPPKPQVAVQEKIVEKPVIIVKEVPVEKIIIQEKIVEKEVPVEKVVIQEKIVEKEVPIEKVVVKELPSQEDTVNQTPKKTYNYAQGKSISLSEAIYNGKTDFDKTFVKHARVSGTLTNGTTPISQAAACRDAQASLSLHKALSHYHAVVKYSSYKKSFNIDVGSISFSFETKSDGVYVTAAGSKPQLISNDRTLHSSINVFSVVSKNNTTQAYCNGALIATLPYLTSIGSINGSVKNHYNDCGYNRSAYSDRLYDLAITEYLVQ